MSHMAELYDERLELLEDLRTIENEIREVITGTEEEDYDLLKFRVKLYMQQVNKLIAHLKY